MKEQCHWMRRFPGGGFYHSEKHTASHPYGEFTHPKQVICTGGKLGSLTLNCLLCHSCCGEFTTDNEAVSEWAVTGGKFVSFHFTTNLAEEMHWLTDSTTLYTQVTLHWMSCTSPLPSYSLSEDQSSKTITGIVCICVWRNDQVTNDFGRSTSWKLPQTCGNMCFFSPHCFFEV